MQKKSLRRAFAMLLAASMLATCGCGQDTTEEKDSESQKVESTSSNSADSESSERVTLTMAKKAMSTVVDYETNYYTTYIEDLANVNIDFTVLSEDSTERAQKLAMMLNSGEKLPDIIMDPISDEWGYIEAGALIPIEDYLNDPEMMPNFHANVPEEDREYIMQCLTQVDGHIYSAALYSPEYTNMYSRKAFINQTWLDNLGLEYPTTTDELYDVLKAFKEQDPNGNGEADEIPMMGAATTNANPTIFLMNAFIYMDNNNCYLYVEDGKVVPAFTDERFLEGLTYVNKLVSEGLLSPLSFTQTGDQFKAISNGDEQVIGSFTRLSTSQYTNEENRNDMTLLNPLTGPNGECYAYYRPVIPSSYFYITKDCEDVEAAIRLMDACYDTTAGMISRWGIPEVHWTTEVSDDMVTVYQDSLGIEPAFAMIENVWGVSQNAHWGCCNPKYADMESPYSTYALGQVADESFEKDKDFANFVVTYADKHPDELIISLLHTAEEKTEYADLKTQIETYVSACIDQFAVGELPLSEWDNYLKELDNMGLERFLELAQIGWDRYNGNE